MRKVVLIMTASIDGYVEAPSGLAVGATAEPPELKRWKLDRIRNAGTHVMGRVTYEQMATAWANLTRRIRRPNERDPQSRFLRHA